MEVEEHSYGLCYSLSKTLGKYNSIWHIVDSLTKSAYSILMQVTYNATKLAKVYLKELFHLNGVINFYYLI